MSASAHRWASLALVVIGAATLVACSPYDADAESATAIVAEHVGDAGTVTPHVHDPGLGGSPFCHLDIDLVDDVAHDDAVRIVAESWALLPDSVCDVDVIRLGPSLVTEQPPTAMPRAQAESIVDALVAVPGIRVSLLLDTPAAWLPIHDDADFATVARAVRAASAAAPLDAAFGAVDWTLAGGSPLDRLVRVETSGAPSEAVAAFLDAAHDLVSDSDARGILAIDVRVGSGAHGGDGMGIAVALTVADGADAAATALAEQLAAAVAAASLPWPVVVTAGDVVLATG